MEIKSYWRFGLAREFHEHGRPFPQQKGRIERVGQGLCSLFGGALHVAMREITNPVTIVALTAIATLLATTVFYPAVVVAALPFVSFVSPWMLKAAVFTVLQTTILGLGLRAFGRLCNEPLREKWNSGDLEPIYIGSKRVRGGV